MPAKPYAVVRSVVIAAEPAQVHGLLADLRRWRLWSPWEARDRQLNRRYSESSQGVGAWFEWEGNLRAGAGRLEILQVTAESIALFVSWRRPFTSEQQMEFRLDPEAEGTRVTWTMHGELTGAAKLATVLFPMSRIHGPVFDRGLDRLKASCEQPGQA